MKTITDEVRDGYARGWSFTPLAGKKPIRDGWQSAERETLDAAIAWAESGNVGIRTGSASGVVVIDLDEGADITGLELPITVTALTGGGGRHLYYAGVGIGNTVKKLGKNIDTRGDAGQCVFVGSTHPDTGKVYRWEDGRGPGDVPIAPLPAWVRAKLAAKPERSRVSTPPPAPRPGGGYAAAAMASELKAVAAAPEGGRNDALNRAAFSLGTLIGGGALAEGEVRAALLAATTLPESEARATIASGITAGIREPRSVPALQTRAAPTLPSPRKQGYALIPGSHVTDCGEYIEVGNHRFADEVLAALPPGAIYSRAGRAVVLAGEPGARRLEIVGVDRLRIIIDAGIRLGKWIKRKDEMILVFVPCSRDLAGLVLSLAGTHPATRVIDLITTYPVYSPGWHVAPPGWRAEIYYDEPPGLAGIAPERDASVIRDVLEDLIADFPFSDAASIANFIGLLITPMIRPAISGNVPMHVIKSSLPRTGKTKLAEEVIGGIYLGEPTPAMQLTADENERDKRILSLLMRGDTMVHLDNLRDFVDSATLASLLTASTYQGRLLGASEIVKVPNNLTVIATGNNPKATGELVKRSVPIVLQPLASSPESRTDFLHPDLRSYVASRRRLVLSCLMGLVEARGDATGQRMGGFEEWAAAVGSAVLPMFPAWMGNWQTWMTDADPEGQELIAFVAAWWDKFQNSECKAIDLMRLAEERELFLGILNTGTERGNVTRFSVRVLGRHENAPVAGWTVRKSKRTNYQMYFLEAERC